MMFGMKKDKRNKPDCTDVWSLYEHGKKYLLGRDYFDGIDRAYRFYDGDQWNGLQGGDENMPMYNIIKPVVKYKVSVVASNAMEIIYNPTDMYDEGYEAYAKTCEVLSALGRNTWERLKMARCMWNDVADAVKIGSKFRYFYWNAQDKRVETEEISPGNIFFADEQQPNIQKQRYILITQRMTVADAKDLAKSYKVPEDEIMNISSDSEYQYEAGDESKYENTHLDADKCTVVTCFKKTKDGISIQRVTQYVTLQKETVITGTTLYPIAAFTWEPRKGFARGIGEVLPLIPNQIEINKNLYRALVVNKQASYPRLAYNRNVITNPADLNTAGAPIEISGSLAEIKQAIGYIEPGHMSADAHALTNTLISTTRELAGAGDIATGQINPEKASGQAILAVQRSAEQPVTDAIEGYKQYIEDIALIWYDLWTAYCGNGLDVAYWYEDRPNKITVSAAELKRMRISVKIDVSPSTPFDKFAQEQSLEHLMQANLITFEEYVDALGEDAIMPKAKLKAILDKRKQAQAPAEPAPPTLPPLEEAAGEEGLPAMPIEGEPPIPTAQIPAVPGMPIPGNMAETWRKYSGNIAEI